MNITISIDDGVKEDLRVAELLDKYKLKGLFYVNSGLIRGGLEHGRGGRYLNLKELLKIAKNHEIGGHGFSHFQDLKELKDYFLKKEIIDDRKILQKWTEQEVNSFCYARGRFNKRVIEVVKEAGYKTARTTRVGYVGNKPYEQSAFHCYQRKEYGKTEWLDYIKEKLKKGKEEGEKMGLFAHSWELNQNSDFGNFEELLRYISLGN